MPRRKALLQSWPPWWRCWVPGFLVENISKQQTRHNISARVQDSHTHDTDLGTKLIDQNLEFLCRAFPGSVGPTRYDCSLVLQAILQVKPPPWVPPFLMGHHLSCTSPDAQQPPSSLSLNTTLSSTGKSKYRVIGRKGLVWGESKTLTWRTQASKRHPSQWIIRTLSCPWDLFFPKSLM